MVRTKRAKAVSLRLTPLSTLRLCANQDKSFTQSRKEKKTVRRKEESPVWFSPFPPKRPGFDRLFGHPKAEECEGLICWADCLTREWPHRQSSHDQYRRLCSCHSQL